MGEIKTDLFPCNLREGKRKMNNRGENGIGENGGIYRNMVISVEEILKDGESGEDGADEWTGSSRVYPVK